ncbi:flagellar filament capping protein FliD [Halochromatium salexigens]|uniref:Flagellar hook-associated protein 2 n=1 Tax=Halochromatium salexigens TaxID=49447 RepID=A0AAJ0XFI2_HALSE|nr:flagellar filament capping protein FliD [Halochromatium salexigens]MBK5929715.1 flagellar hook protein [Halochromatium salexigens]
MSTITSLGIGSGLDLNGLLDQLRDAERGRLEPLAQQKEAQEAKLSAYGKLQGALSAFQSASSALNSSSLYESVSSNVTGSSVTSAANSDAVPGRYDVTVNDLARSQSIATDGFAEEHTFSEGTLSIETGSGTFEIAVADGDTLATLRDSINDADAGVTASIVNDGSANPFRLVLMTDETGEDAAIQSIDFVDGSGTTIPDEGLTFDGTTGTGEMEEVAEAQNATLKVNGIDITSQGNRVEEAIQGVTLDLAETGDSTVIVERNNRGVRDAVNAFVDNYNSLRETTNELTSFNAETGEAGELLGDSTLRTIESRLRSTLGSGVAEGEFRSLSEIGISLQRDGTLQLDDARLDEVIVNDREALTEFFAGQSQDSGMAGALSQTLSQLLGDSGLLDNARSGVQNRITSIDNRTERMEISIERTIERYRSQFAQLDSMVAEMNQTSSYLTQQFDNLNAMLGGE